MSGPKIRFIVNMVTSERDAVIMLRLCRMMRLVPLGPNPRWNERRHIAAKRNEYILRHAMTLHDERHATVKREFSHTAKSAAHNATENNILALEKAQ